MSTDPVLPLKNISTSGGAQRRPLSPAERAMRIAWKVQLSEDTRQRKLATRRSAAEMRAAAVAKRMRKVKRHQAEARKG